MGSYRVIFTGTTENYSGHESLYTLTLKAASKINITMNIELDIKNIDFKDGIVLTGMFSGEDLGNYGIVISFIFPENKIKTIEMLSFTQLYNTKEITLPDSLITIKDNSFVNSQSIEVLNLGNGVQTIGMTAFAYLESLKELVIPKSVTSIGIRTFANLLIKEVSIPASVNTLGSSAFAGSPNLSTVVYYGTSPDTINNKDALSFCAKLTTLILPNVTNPVLSEWQNFLGGNFTIVKQN